MRTLIADKPLKKTRINWQIISPQIDDKLDENGFYPEEAAELKRRAEDVEAGITVKYGLIEG